MTTRTIEGWLFDVYEFSTAMVLWLYNDAGALHRVTHEFATPIFAHGTREQLKQLSAELYRRRLITGGRWERKREFWSGDELDVMQLNVPDVDALRRLREFAVTQSELTFFNFDIPAAQYYLCLHGLFPLCRLACTVDRYDAVQTIRALNSPWDIAQPLPPLRIMHLRGERMQPLSAHSRLLLECAEQTCNLSFSGGARFITAFQQFLTRHDPDLILSERGDTILFPALLQLAQRERMTLCLDRDPLRTERKIETEGRTYFSYGKVIYKGPSYPLLGRWHIDRQNSFAFHETDLEGTLELARLGRLPVQRAARRSAGTSMTSLEIEQALSAGFLIPWQKAEPERFKTALDLLRIDKGGLTFQPPVGIFAEVAEIDFAAMYPSLMVTRNISPETVLCRCCQNEAVPEARYNVCEKRRGVIPLTLAPLIERRKRLKQLLKTTEDPQLRALYEARRAAIKWMLVTSFGYMGYRNARLGRIEAHEATTALGRDTLLRAKEIAEARGYEMLHGLTDSLWLQRAGLNETDVLALCDEITQTTGIEMSLEGLYRWIIFLPSKVNPQRPVPARYYGVFQNGELKARGLAYRRHDTPPFIKAVQQELLEIVATAHTLAELGDKQAAAAAVLAERIAALERGEIPLAELLITQTLSRAPQDYAVATRTALAAQQLIDEGIPVHPGETIGYVIAEAKARDREQRVATNQSRAKAKYDVAEYVRLLRVAGEEICDPLRRTVLLPPAASSHTPMLPF